jgi:catechol 2,3-dioxygenase-like lactoylglutathione lyase family enzyme
VSNSSQTSHGIQCVAAITLPTNDMARAVKFYQSLGFVIHFGGGTCRFSTLVAGTAHVNLMLIEKVTEPNHTCPEENNCSLSQQTRVIFHVSDVDGFYRQVQIAGWIIDSVPADAAWGERFFHLMDPDGNLLSFACPIDQE